MNKINLIYYSPTGTTSKIAKELANNFDANIINDINITYQDVNLKNFDNDSFTIIGAPTYGGRIPVVVAEKLSNFKIENLPAVIYVVYGNRDYEDSLLELYNLANSLGFNVIAAAAFIGEHSFSTDEKPIAKGRPDEKDILKISEFTEGIKNNLDAIIKGNKVLKLKIPGKYPYKIFSKSSGDLSPETKLDICNNCGICIDVCPVNAITINGNLVTNKEICTWCCACIKICPKNARYFNEKLINNFRDKLHTLYSVRKEPEIFL